jgi:TPR repeat protein
LASGISVVVLGSALVSCGAGGAAEAVRPADPTAKAALGETECRSVEKGGEPLVVDWKAEQRGDLEVAMKDGVAVVAYSCQSIKLLPDCHIDGTYGYIGMTTREQVVRLESGDEVRANLPFTGGALAAEMQRGATLDVAMVMIGKRRTTWSEPNQADLKGGSCAGATHYVRGATVGAFVLSTGTQAKVAAAAELFGAGTSGNSASAKETKNRDGDPSECAKAAPDSTSPPPQCGAPIRLVLGPIAKTPEAGKPVEAAPPKAPVASDVTTCPAGLVQSGGKCTAPASAPAFQCNPSDAAECGAQCDKGHAGSCAALGDLIATTDPTRSAGAFKKGCDGDVAAACFGLGRLTERGQGVKADPKGAADLYERACKGGSAAGCGAEGRVTTDPARAFALFSQGCNGGDDASCRDAALSFAQGKGVAKDLAKAAELHKRACDGSIGQSCYELGGLYESGAQGVGKNAIHAELLYRRGCTRGSTEACVDLGRLEFERNPTEAKIFFDQGCMKNVKLACAILNVGFGDRRPVFPDVAQKNALTQSCNAGSMKDCAIVGILDAASNMPMGKMNLKRACMAGDKFACEMAKKAK